VIDFFAAEEQGLRGSWDRIEKISTPIWQEDIKAVINLDMIGYCQSDSTDYIFDLITYHNSDELTQMAREFAEQYTMLTPNETTENNYASDSYSFYSYGVKSVFLMEYEFTPHYHTERDVYNTINYHYMRELTKLAFALAYECSVNNNYGVVSLEQDKSFAKQVVLLTNPVKDNLRISCRNFSSTTQYVLYSQSSQIIKQGRIENPNGVNTIDCKDLKSGIYFFRIIDENQVLIKKIIVL
jgi:Zn-dependent M28 family amino/carboxypeptidase